MALRKLAHVVTVVPVRGQDVGESVVVEVVKREEIGAVGGWQRQGIGVTERAAAEVVEDVDALAVLPERNCDVFPSVAIQIVQIRREGARFVEQDMGRIAAFGSTPSWLTSPNVV